MKKKVLLVAMAFVLIFCGITFSSCGEKVILPSSAISLSMMTNSDGTIIQEIDFSLQTQRLKDLQVNERMIREIKSNFLSSLNMLKNEFLINFLLIYSSNPSEEYKIGENLLISEPYLDEDADVAGFKIVYKSIAVLQYFQTGKAQDDQLLGKTIPVKFYSHTESQGKFPFAGEYVNRMGENLTVGERYLGIYNNCFNKTISNDLCAQLGVPSFVYDYAAPFSNLRTNADIEVQNGQMFHHIWVRDAQNFKDGVIELSTTVVYSGWWYLTLLVAAIVIFALGLVIIKLKK